MLIFTGSAASPGKPRAGYKSSTMTGNRKLESAGSVGRRSIYDANKPSFDDKSNTSTESPRYVLDANDLNRDSFLTTLKEIKKERKQTSRYKILTWHFM